MNDEIITNLKMRIFGKNNLMARALGKMHVFGEEAEFNFILFHFIVFYFILLPDE
jgi:hypothetical protein